MNKCYENKYNINSLCLRDIWSTFNSINWGSCECEPNKYKLYI